MRFPFARRFHSRAGFKMAELMVAVGIFVLGGGIAYPLLVGDVNLYARNFSLNKSDNSLRYSLQMLKKDIDMSIEPPALVSYSVAGNAGVLKALPAATVSAQGILLWVNLGPAYDMQGTGTNGSGSVPVTSTITLNRRVNLSPPPGGNDAFPNSPEPQIGDRLIIMSPAPYSTGMPESVNMGGNTIQKPGRRITSVNNATSGRIVDNGSSTVTVKLDLTNTPLPSGITGPQSVYVVREVAYVVYTLNDAGGNPVESQLLYYPSTADMTKAHVLIRDVDPVMCQTFPPFNYVGGRGNLSPLSINMPVRAIDYANAASLGKTSPTSEFNVYMLSNPQMGVKVRLD